MALSLLTMSLLEVTSPANVRDAFLREQYFLALEGGNPEVFSLLVKQSTTLMDRNMEQDYSPILIDELIQLAIRKRLWPMLDVITDPGWQKATICANITLIRAAAAGDTEAMEYADKRGATAWNHVLWVSANRNDQQTAKLALNKGATELNFALGAAIFSQYFEMGEFLVSYGADRSRLIEARDDDDSDDDEEVIEARERCVSRLRKSRNVRIPWTAVMHCHDTSLQNVYPA